MLKIIWRLETFHYKFFLLGDIEQLRSLLNYIKLPFVKSHPSLMQALIHLLPYLSFGNKEKMQTLLDYFKLYLEFDRFD
ncbi:unnamed protein product, partial [Rotaria magnacalcarata]